MKNLIGTDGTYSELARHIFGLCNKHTEYKLQNEFFASWYIRAFPEKTLENFDDTYCIEWIGRFIKGTPTIYMDGQRLRAYFETAIEWNKSSLRITTDKVKVLLQWEGDRFDRYILNKTIAEDTDEEEYYIATQYDGTYTKRKR